MSQHIGFIGIGNMGWPMAAALIRAGHRLTVADSDDIRVEKFVANHGGHPAASLRELAEKSDVIITILPTSKIVAHVLATGEDTVLAGMKPGTIVIEMSSGVPNITRELAEKVAALGGHMIDAPVSGGVARAKTATLAIMAGGETEIIDRVQPVLEAMGNSILRTGGVGSAHAMKALNNLVSAGGLLVAVEALLIGQRFGLDPGVMTDVLNASTGMNNATQKKLRQFILSRSFGSGFGLDLMGKDLAIALEVARDTATPAPFAAQCRELWAAAAAMLGPGQDHTAVAKFSEALAGSELGEAAARD